MQLDGLALYAAVKSLAALATLTLPELPRRKETPTPPLQASAPPLANERQMTSNQSSFSNAQIESLLATAARLLVRQKHVAAASLLANAKSEVVHWEQNTWNGVQDIWRLFLSIPADVYVDLEGREDREREIDAALEVAMEALSQSDHMQSKIITNLDEDPDWRHKINRHLSGEGITNQGRARSGHVATLEHDGLLFRSTMEIRFYNALKRSGVPFAPLSVVLHGGIGYKRIEPDFVIYKQGIMLIVEIDSDFYHKETPAAAHARLKFLTDEGMKIERIKTSECDTPLKAGEAVERLLATIEKWRR